MKIRERRGGGLKFSNLCKRRVKKTDYTLFIKLMKEIGMVIIQ